MREGPLPQTPPHTMGTSTGAARSAPLIATVFAPRRSGMLGGLTKVGNIEAQISTALDSHMSGRAAQGTRLGVSECIRTHCLVADGVRRRPQPRAHRRYRAIRPDVEVQYLGSSQGAARLASPRSFECADLPGGPDRPGG